MPDSKSINRILNEIRQELNSCGIEDAWLEASMLLEAFTGLDRLEQLRRPGHQLTDLQIRELKTALQKRCRRKPLSQILGEIWFYGRPYYVSEDVLTPRADTEILVEAVIKEMKERYRGAQKSMIVLDTCTGSGCIAISIWIECEKAGLISGLDLNDTSEKALKIARRNAERHALPEDRLSYYTCDLWPDNNTLYDVITCNPPYINESDMEQLVPEVALYEPRSALYGGRDGLDFYRRLAEEAAEHLSSAGLLAVEHAYDQRKVIKEIFAASPLRFLEEFDDYGGNARVLMFEKSK